MPFAVKLFFDEQSDRRIREAWADLAAQGVSSWMQTSGYRPHLTLAGFEGFEPELPEILAAVAEREKGFKVTFAALGAFTRPEGVVYLSPVVDSVLSGFHKQLWARVETCLLSQTSHYLPKHWMPHCTLAMKLQAQETAAAFAAIVPFELPLHVDVVSMALVEIPGGRELAVWPLAGRVDG